MRALICGISGQDGAYLAKFLLDKGYEVCGTSRNTHTHSFETLRALGIGEKIRLFAMAPTDYSSVYSVVGQVRPDEIYNLAGQSSVGLSFDKPSETIESIVLGGLNFLEVLRVHFPHVRYYNAGSGECFGDTGDEAADETTPFRPRSPYAVAKAMAFWQVANYREVYGLHASSGLLFNHESPLRPERFVTQKIVASACRIARGSTEKLILGNIDIRRDWGWAPDYVEAMWLMTRADSAADYVVATGRTTPLSHFIELVFREVGLDWTDHTVVSEEMRRPFDNFQSCANPARIRASLGWCHKYEVEEVVREMVYSKWKQA